jgi:hypothetical protein
MVNRRHLIDGSAPREVKLAQYAALGDAGLLTSQQTLALIAAGWDELDLED